MHISFLLFKSTKHCGIHISINLRILPYYLLLLCTYDTGVYVWDALYAEKAILTTMDITTDGFGKCHRSRFSPTLSLSLTHSFYLPLSQSVFPSLPFSHSVALSISLFLSLSFSLFLSLSLFLSSSPFNFFPYFISCNILF